MSIVVEPNDGPCGAQVRGLDLSRPLDPEQVREIRAAWLEHQVLTFPDQSMDIVDLERFALYMGPRSEDPFIEALPGHPHVIEVRREASETSSLFAESWHSDWSFLEHPPAGTVLYGVDIPPVGGETLFADQYAAYEGLPDEMKARLDGLQAIHSARRGYSRAGLYGDRDSGRSMAIRPSDAARATRSHPLVRPHPETGRKALYVSPAYTVGVEDLPDDEARELLEALFVHQVAPPFVYRHRWQPGMLTLWDNRCLLHRATGGYEGYRRLLRRVTVAETIPEPQARAA